MTVLSAFITTRSGKTLLSRQFVEISKDRVMELLSNFESLVAKVSSEHTYVEDEHVRYLYKPLDDYYLILVTNRQSNIIQDLSTLSLFSQAMDEYLSGFDEYDVFENSFEILCAFDEIVAMGMKENLTLTQIETYLTMESHEERIQEIIERNKETEAAEERKRRAKEIAKREHDRKMGIPTSDLNAADGARFHTSDDPNLYNAYNSYYSQASEAAQQSYLQTQHMPIVKEQFLNKNETSRASSGMKLGEKSKQINSRISSQPASKPKDDLPKFDNNGILVCIKEQISAQITRDGAISSSELKGVLEYRVNDASLAHSQITIGKNIKANDKSFHFKTHPNIDKNLFASSNVLGLRNKDKAFPSNDHSLGVLRWRKVSGADDKTIVPLEVSTWVSASDDVDGKYEITVEYEINESFKDVKLEDLIFTIPVYTESVQINDDNNDVNAVVENIDDETGVSIKVDNLVPGSSGVFSFTIESDSEESMFPIDVSFKNITKGNGTLTDITVESVTSTQEEDAAFPFDVITVLKNEEYVIV